MWCHALIVFLLASHRTNHDTPQRPETGHPPVGDPRRSVADHSEPSGKRTIFAELRRRNVFSAAVIYVAAVWALSQGIAQLAPAFGMPDWVTRWFVIVCVIGFPFWIAFAWFFEFTLIRSTSEPRVDLGYSLCCTACR